MTRYAKELIFVTSNEDKAREVAATLRVKVKRVNLELDEIQEMDLGKIIEHKTKQAFAKLKKPVIAEDVGLYIKEWNGFPGPFIKWAHSTIGYDKLPKLISGNKRKAEWIVAYGLYDGKKFYQFTGRLDGVIAHSQRGKKGWGFDTLFIPKGQQKTMAELGGAVKLRISARRKALDKLARFINSY